MGAPVAATDQQAAGPPPGGGAEAAAADGLERIAARRGPVAALRFAASHRMLTPKYALLALRFAVRRLLTPAGRRLETDGMVFLGPRLQIQIARGARVRLGRFAWIGHGTKIRCHEGEVEIGAKTVIGQDCTISAYRRVRIGEQCVIADRAMFIDFDHNVADTEQPIRRQGIYMRDVEVGNNVWIGYNAQILRGVRVGDNSIIGANSVVTRDIPANAVAAGTPARVIRMREAPKTLRWSHPVEPPEYGPPGPR
jgi:acetyltransferase-like isoleucine patch superfamily enzyme